MKYTLYHGDCLKEMDRIPDKSVDAIIADLPFGTTNCSWDVTISFSGLWSHFGRVIKDRGAIVLFGSEPFASQLLVSNPKWFRYEWIWKKNQSTGFLNAKKHPLKQHEKILVFSRKAHYYYPQITHGHAEKKTTRTTYSDHYGSQVETSYCSTSRYPTSILEFDTVDNNSFIHPTQKPIGLLEYLVRTYTRAGEKVLDCTMGSGSTGVACGNLGRDFTGIELYPLPNKPINPKTNPNYFYEAQARIMNAYDDFTRTPEEIKRGQLALWE